MTEGVPHFFSNGERLPSLESSQVKMKEYETVFVQYSDILQNTSYNKTN